MPAIRVDLFGTVNIGAFCFANDHFLLIPKETPVKTVNLLVEALQVPAVKVTISGSVLIGILIAGNSSGIIVPSTAHEEELLTLKRELSINIVRINSKKTALGNLVLANDKAAMVSTELSKTEMDAVSDALGVESFRGSLAGFTSVGAVGVATNKGVLAHPKASQSDLAQLREIFKVPVDISTVNCGSPLLRIGMVANSKGAALGSVTTGHELAHIEASLGITR